MGCYAMGIDKFNDFKKIISDCGSISKNFSDKDIDGILSIEDLLQKGFDKHVGIFEIPESIKNIMSMDEVNAVITWYLSWKITCPIEKQNTCTIRDTFGYKESIKVIIAINFYKYLRNKGYDPDIVEIFLKQQ